MTLDNSSEEKKVGRFLKRNLSVDIELFKLGYRMNNEKDGGKWQCYESDMETHK